MSSASPEVVLALDARTALGEAPRWHAGEGALYFVDISAHQLHRFDPASGEVRTRTFDQPVGSFAFRRGGGFVLAMRDGFGLIDSFEGKVRAFGPQIEAGRNTRFNDGRAGPDGRFYAGAIDIPKRDSAAALYRLDAAGAVTKLADGALTSNGVAFSPDGGVLYWADTPRHVLYAFDFNAESGAISNRRVFHQFPEGEGRPDGGSVDVDGFYWSALYAGGRVVRLSPQGEIVQEVAIPASHPTMIAFGGEDRLTAYVTSAREAMSEADLERFPHGGGVFSFRVETPGLPEYDFAG